jgi:glutamyl/glutaminyl-tRNA synthetase
LYSPYVQTQKLVRYQELAYQLIKADKAYYCFCTKEELQKQREEAIKQGLTPKYNRHCLNLSQQEIQNKLKNGVPAAIRFKMPENIDIK